MTTNSNNKLLRRFSRGSIQIAAALKIRRFATLERNEASRITAIAPKKFKPNTTDSNHDLRISPNLLKELLNHLTGKGKALAGDINYLPLPDGKFCCL